MKERYSRIRKLRLAWEKKRTMSQMKLAQANSRLRDVVKNIEELKSQLSEINTARMLFQDLTMKHLTSLDAQKSNLAKEVETFKSKLLQDEIKVLAITKIEILLRDGIEMAMQDTQMQEILETMGFGVDLLG